MNPRLSGYISILGLASLCSSLFWELRDNGVLKNLQFSVRVPCESSMKFLIINVLSFPGQLQCKPGVSSHVTLFTRLHHRGVCFHTYNNGQYKIGTADCGLGIKHGLGIKCGLRTTLVKTVLIGYR